MRERVHHPAGTRELLQLLKIPREERVGFKRHLKALVTVGLITQVRESTTLVCHANYDVMRGLVDFLVAECCADAECRDAKTAA